METHDTAAAPEGQSTPNASSLGSRMMNVIAAPGDVFDEVRRSPDSAANWLVPTALSIVAGIIFTFVVFSQPNIQQQIREAQEKALSQKVQEGKMTKAQMDQAMTFIDKYSGSMTKIFGSIGVVFVNFGRLFWWGMVIWLLGRWALRTPFPYMKGVEAAGLTMMITMLGALVALLMIVSMGRLNAGPTLAFGIEHFDTTNKSHVALAAVNVFNIWFVGVIAAALAKLTNTSYAKAAAWTLGLWLAWEGFLLVTPLNQLAL